LKTFPFIIILFAALVHALYLPAWNAGFVTDFTGLLGRIEGQSIAGVLDCFGFPALEQALNLFLFAFVKLFGTSPLPWYLVFTSVHILNGYLLFRLCLKIFRLSGLEEPFLPALAAALFFLASPYQSEPLVWRVCFNFLFSSLLILGVLWQTVRWQETRRPRFLWTAQGVFLVALFTFELSLIAPALVLALLLFWSFTRDEAALLPRRFLRITLPQIAMTGGYFILNRLLLGAWIGHYGAAVHLRFDLPEILGNFIRYALKIGGLIRYFDHPVKERIFLAFNQPAVLWTAVGAALILFILYLIYFRRIGARLRLGGLFLVLFLFSLLPIINLYFNYLLHIENDRYGYLASMFFFAFAALLLSHLPRRLFIAVSLLYLAVNIYFLAATNRYWKQSTRIYYALLKDFRWYDAPEVYVLNLPDNLQGAVLFRDYSGQDLALNHALYYIAGKAPQGKIYEIAQYNLTAPVDGVDVQRDSAGVFTVTFNQWGNWWWRRGLGATSYETDKYSFSNEGHSYRLEFKSTAPGAVVIYQAGEKWVEVEMQ
jgi:hypothetical protein